MKNENVFVPPMELVRWQEPSTSIRGVKPLCVHRKSPTVNALAQHNYGQTSSTLLLSVGQATGVGGGIWIDNVLAFRQGRSGKALQLSEPVAGAGVVFAADSQALLSWSAKDRKPLGELRGLVGSDPQIVRMSTYEGTLYFCADLPEDAGMPGKHLLHAVDIASRKILWTHRTNRAAAGFTDWQTSYTVPTSSGVYYDNEGLFAKVAR